VAITKPPPTTRRSLSRLYEHGRKFAGNLLAPFTYRFKLVLQSKQGSILSKYEDEDVLSFMAQTTQPIIDMIIRENTERGWRHCYECPPQWSLGQVIEVVFEPQAGSAARRDAEAHQCHGHVHYSQYLDRLMNVKLQQEAKGRGGGRGLCTQYPRLRPYIEYGVVSSKIHAKYVIKEIISTS
jgi:hypothetical protein